MARIVTTSRGQLISGGGLKMVGEGLDGFDGEGWSEDWEKALPLITKTFDTAGDAAVNFGSKVKKNFFGGGHKVKDPSKPKRMCSQAQLEALARGRQKAAENRAIKKK